MSNRALLAAGTRLSQQSRFEDCRSQRCTMEIHSGISTVRIAPGGLLNHVRCNSLHVGIFDVLEGDKVADVRDRIAKAA